MRPLVAAIAGPVAIAADHRRAVRTELQPPLNPALETCLDSKLRRRHGSESQKEHDQLACVNHAELSEIARMAVAQGRLARPEMQSRPPDCPNRRTTTNPEHRAPVTNR